MMQNILNKEIIIEKIEDDNDKDKEMAILVLKKLKKN